MESSSKRESLSMRLIGSKGELLVAQGDVPNGPYTIGYGVIVHVEHLRVVPRWFARTFKDSPRYIPSDMKDVRTPSTPIVHCDPVTDKTNTQKMLQDLGFEHYRGQCAFYSEPCKTRIEKIIHMGLSNFKQDYVARVNYQKRKGKIIWP